MEGSIEHDAEGPVAHKSTTDSSETAYNTIVSR
jgi:hypothetical protein